MSDKETKMAELLKQALADLIEHQNEYHHQSKPGLIDEIRAILKGTE